MAQSDSITVTITYSLALQEITGKAMETAIVSPGMRFLHFLFFIFESYPEIQEKYPPGTVGMLVNDVPPQEDYIMQEGDTLSLAVLRPEY